MGRLPYALPDMTGWPIGTLEEMNKLKQSLKNLGLLLFGLLFALAVSEMLLRAWTPDSIAYKHVRQPDPVLHHSLKPSSSYVLKTSEFEVEIRTNSMGFRDREYDPTDRDKFKILVMGDSFVEGYGVIADSCFVRRVERDLNLHGTIGYRVFNFGVASYSPIIEYLLLRSRGLDLNPQLVILCFDMSDIQDDLLYGEFAELDSSGIPVKVVPRVLPSGRPSWFLPQGAFGDFIRKYSYVYAFLSPLVDRFKAEPIAGLTTLKGRILHTEDSVTGRWQRYFERSESYIKDVSDLLRARGINLLLVVYPWGHQVNANEWTEGRKLLGLEQRTYNSAIFSSLERFAQRDSIPFLNMTETFRYHSNGHLYYRIDEHWTNEGHRVAADTLAEYLLHSKLLR